MTRNSASLLKMDSQTIEILGRNRLINELLHAGLEVAIPARDRGIDLIAYVDLAAAASVFAAVPIQMKAASAKSFAIDAKYERISNLILAFVWGVRTPENAQTFALTYPEALEIASAVEWTRTDSWEKGSYSTSRPSKELCELLKTHRMSTASDWRKKIEKVSKATLQPLP